MESSCLFPGDEKEHAWRQRASPTESSGRSWVGLKRCRERAQESDSFFPTLLSFALEGAQMNPLKCEVTQPYSTVVKEIGVSMTVVNISVSSVYNMHRKVL